MWVSNIRAKRAAIEDAGVCVALSAATAADLARFFPATAQRVRVIHLGHEHLTPAARIASINRHRHALFVGHRDGYKNFVTDLEGMTHPAWPSGVSLRVVGAPLEKHERGLIGYYGLADQVVAVGRVTDEQLAAEYAAETCLVFPSRLEGFGLPVLEAQLNGCPVVCSDIPVFREVAGEAAVFFDPRLGERLAEAVATACGPGVHHRLREAGRENVRRFSWDRAADQTLAVYEEAAAIALG
jgi:glycosyltransferase involved in cell wall biosynthesis